jgi:hypothetical protein
MKYTIIDTIPKVNETSGRIYYIIYFVNTNNKCYYIELPNVTNYLSLKGKSIKINKYSKNQAILALQQLLNEPKYYSVNNFICPVCNQQLYELEKTHHCININCNCGSPLESLFDKINIIANIPKTIFRDYIWGLFNTTGYDLHTLIQAIYIINITKKAVFNKVDLEILNNLYNSYRNLNIIQFFKLCKYPIQYLELIIELNKLMSLKELFDGIHVIDHILSDILFSREFKNYVTQTINMNQPFLKSYFLS